MIFYLRLIHFPSGFQKNTFYAFLNFIMRSIYFEHRKYIFLDLNILTIFSEEYKLKSFQLWSSLQSSAASSLRSKHYS
jgi:hypothetical protein